MRGTHLALAIVIVFAFILTACYKQEGKENNSSATNNSQMAKPQEETDGCNLKPFDDGVRFGYKDENGKIIIPCKFRNAYEFNEGLAGASVESGFGFINCKGEWVIKPQYGSVGRFSEGLASVLINGKSGYIDKSSKIVIEAMYDQAQEFINGKAVVGVFTMIGKLTAGLDLGGECRYFEIDKKGNVVK